MVTALRSKVRLEMRVCETDTFLVAIEDGIVAAHEEIAENYKERDSKMTHE